MDRQSQSAGEQSFPRSPVAANPLLLLGFAQPCTLRPVSSALRHSSLIQHFGPNSARSMANCSAVIASGLSSGIGATFCRSNSLGGHCFSRASKHDRQPIVTMERSEEIFRETHIDFSQQHKDLKQPLALHAVNADHSQSLGNTFRSAFGETLAKSAETIGRNSMRN